MWPYVCLARQYCGASMEALMVKKRDDAPGARPYGVFTKQELADAMQVKWPAVNYLQRARELCGGLRSTKEGDETFLNRRGPAKELCDEMLPLGYLCEYFLERNWPGSEIQLILGNQKYDAIVSNATVLPGMPTHIEVTGIDPKDTHKLRQELAKAGVAKEVFSERERLYELADLLRDRLLTKSGNGYPPGTLLLMFQNTNERLRGWMNIITEVSRSCYNELAMFDWVVVMNQRGIDLDFRPLGLPKS